jgi:hypothetical protein
MKLMKAAAQTYAIFLVAVIVLTPLARAQTPKPEPEVLELTDGERLIGHLLSGAGASFTFHSDAVGDVKVDWAKVKSLKTTGKFAVTEKGGVLGRHADVAAAPQGTISVSDQKLKVDPGAGNSPTVIPVSSASNVVPEADFLNAFKSPNLFQDWHGSAGLGIDLIEATEDTRNITAGVSLQRVVSGETWISPRYKTLFDFNLADGQLSEPGKSTINADIIHATIEHDIFLSSSFFTFGTADFLHSLSQGMRLQQTYGGGVGFVLFKNDHQELDLKGSIAYIRQSFEDVVLADGTSTPSPGKSLIGATIGESYSRTFQHGVALKEGLILIPAFNDSSAYTSNAFVNLLIPVHKHISITLGGVDAYVNEPPEGFKKNSFEFVTQLSYKIN